MYCVEKVIFLFIYFLKKNQPFVNTLINTVRTTKFQHQEITVFYTVLMLHNFAAKHGRKTV